MPAGCSPLLTLSPAVLLPPACRLRILGSKVKRSRTRKEPPAAVLQAMQQQRQELPLLQPMPSDTAKVAAAAVPCALLLLAWTYLCDVPIFPACGALVSMHPPWCSAQGSDTAAGAILPGKPLHALLAASPAAPCRPTIPPTHPPTLNPPAHSHPHFLTHPACCLLLHPPMQEAYGLMDGLYSTGLSQDDEQHEETATVDGDTFEEGEQQGWACG